jgi:hypothetical protein
MPGFSQWAHTHFKCQILRLCRNQINPKSSRVVPTLNWFVLQKTASMLTHHTTSKCLGDQWGNKTPKDPFRPPRIKLQSVCAICPSLPFLPVPGAVQLRTPHIYAAFWFSIWMAIWGPGTSCLLGPVHSGTLLFSPLVETWLYVANSSQHCGKVLEKSKSHCFSP